MNAMERRQSWIYLVFAVVLGKLFGMVVYLQWVPGRLIPESV